MMSDGLSRTCSKDREQRTGPEQKGEPRRCKAEQARFCRWTLWDTKVARHVGRPQLGASLPYIGRGGAMTAQNKQGCRAEGRAVCQQDLCLNAGVGRQARFYERRAEIEQVQSYIKKYRAAGEVEKAAEVQRENAHILRLNRLAVVGHPQRPRQGQRR